MKLQFRNPRQYEDKLYRTRTKRKHKKYKPQLIPAFSRSTIERNSVSFFNRTYSRRFFSAQLLFLDQSGYVSKDYVRDVIHIPKQFTFTGDYDGVVLVLKQLLSAFILGRKSVITLDFSKCTVADLTCFTLIEILKTELNGFLDKHNERSYVQVRRILKFIGKNENEKIQKYMHIFGWVEEIKVNEADRYLKMPLITGRKKAKYFENPKALASTKVVEFVNKSLKSSSCVLNERGITQINNFIGEVLNNAEDHSLDRSEWFVDGVSFIEKQKDVDVVELNLMILNYGHSMYGGFEETRVQNTVNYAKLETLHEKHKKIGGYNNFNKESLFTLYMLNEGISRLKYKSESRGNGTMNFIRAFIGLGAFGAANAAFKPRLTIVSGHTLVKCSIDRAPYEDGNFYKISLNKENDLAQLPDVDCLTYSKLSFPGTILECKVYLNKDFFKSIFINENK